MNETEKYGVEEESEEAKVAAEGAKKCPTCGGMLRPREITGVLLCVKCGSKPFESEDPPNHGAAKPR